jgi:hypothetical protein
MDAPPGVPGVSKNQNFFLQINVLSSCPFDTQNIKNRVFRFELFSVHVPLCYLGMQYACWIMTWDLSLISMDYLQAVRSARSCH